LGFLNRHFQPQKQRANPCIQKKIEKKFQMRSPCAGSVKNRKFQFGVIPAQAGIQSFQYVLDAPGSLPGQAYQVRHDESGTFNAPLGSTEKRRWVHKKG
jgi:hypothetical protein